MARGAAWMVLMRLVMRTAGLINMIILARLLVPEDFGLVAMAMIFVGAVEALSEFNFDVVLIKNRDARRHHYDTAWTLSIIRGAAVAALLLAIAEPAARLFDEARLEAIIAVLSLSSLFLGFQNIAVVDFRKSLDFKRDFVFMASDKVVAVVLTVAVALIWRNYWALVAGILGGKLWRLGASYVMHAYRPRLSLQAWRELFRFTKWLLLHNILLFARNRTDRVIIGKMLGATTLGLYTIAFDLANLVTTELMAPIRRALFPGYAKIAVEPERMRRLFIDIFGLTFWIGAPVAVGVGLIADPLVHLLFGADWAAAVPITQMLVFAGFIALLSSGSHPVYLALGRPELQTLIGGLSVLLLLPGLIIGVQSSGVIGAAIAVVLVQTTVALVDILLISHFLKLEVGALLLVCWRSLAALGLMTASVIAVMSGLPTIDGMLGHALLLFSAVGMGAVSYLLGSFGLWRLFGDDEAPERLIWQAVLGMISTVRMKWA